MAMRLHLDFATSIRIPSVTRNGKGLEMPAKKGHRLHIAAYIDEPVYEALRGLSLRTRVPTAAYLREAVDDLLRKYKAQIPKARRKP
jgi:hypothetical protein